MALGGSEKGIADSIKASHPLGALSDVEKADFLSELKPEEMDVYKRASEWYRKTYAPSTPEDTDPISTAMGDAAVSQAELGIRHLGRPQRQEAESAEEYAERLAGWKENRKLADDWLWERRKNPAVRESVKSTMEKGIKRQARGETIEELRDRNKRWEEWREFLASKRDVAAPSTNP